MRNPHFTKYHLYRVWKYGADIDWFNVLKPKAAIESINTLLPEPLRFPQDLFEDQDLALFCVWRCADPGGIYSSVIAICPRNTLLHAGHCSPAKLSLFGGVVESQTLARWIARTDGELSGVLDHETKIEQSTPDHKFLYEMVESRFRKMLGLEGIETIDSDEDVYGGYDGIDPGGIADSKEQIYYENAGDREHMGVDESDGVGEEVEEE